jgi:3alpha(or 20beta)-hydroxysteroid dehydrogenase
VLITGAASGMGASHAHEFVNEGARVLIADVNDTEGARLAGELGNRAAFLHLDVRDPVAWAAAVRGAEQVFGPISVLVNNAEIAPSAVSIVDSDPADWQRVIDINLTGTYLGIRAVVPSMRRAGGGSIINVSSVAGLGACGMPAAYVASKWAIRGLTKRAARELGPEGIRVNSVHPGLVLTPLTSGMSAGEAMAGFAIPRAAISQEISRLVLFVASDDASLSTGSELIADGGLLLGSSHPSAGGVESEAGERRP